ncbi:N-acetylneuraminate synthase family protein [Akkermansiaceae bacterium]|nr:N-acetylneuraminate synthase family protein [Akkermansiaceae bacterium]
MSNKPCFLIAEIGQAHDGSLGTCHSYIDALAPTGVDAVKFQTHIANAESSIHEPFRVKFSKQDQTRLDYWRRMEFTLEQWRELKEHCEDVGVEFISSPFSMLAVEWLEELGMDRYKIASGEVSNLLMLDRIAQTGKPVILSSGMSSLDDLEETVLFLNDYQCEVSVLQCTTAYPTPPKRVGLNVLAELQARFPGKEVGLSDHSGTIYPSLAAVTMGASILEFHTTFDRRMFGPDTTSSLEIDQVRQLVEGVRFLDECIAHPIDKTASERYGELRNMFGKSLAVNKELLAGHQVTAADLETKKPAGKGIDPMDFRSVVGKKLVTDVGQYDFLTAEMIDRSHE